MCSEACWTSLHQTGHNGDLVRQSGLKTGLLTLLTLIKGNNYERVGGWDLEFS